MTMSRRDALKLGVFAGAAVALPLERSVTAEPIPFRMADALLPTPFTRPFATPMVLAKDARSDANTDYYTMEMTPTIVEIAAGFRTTMWGYNGVVPGPTIKAEFGRETVVRHVNLLPATHPELRFTPWTSVHLHGMPSLPPYDGYASDVSNPGQFKDYRYPNTCAARTLWYHDHGVHHTAENVTMGLAGQYHVSSPAERNLPLPQGDHDVPVIIGDVMLQESGELLLDHHDRSGMFGDIMMVNGTPWPVMTVARRKYRFRLLNACVGRSLNLGLSSGRAFQVIATDGGLMPAPVSTRSLIMGMAERYEIVIDFSEYQAGTRVRLMNTTPRNNIDYANTDKIMAFDVVADGFDMSNNSVPSVLDPANPVMSLRREQAVRTRRLDFVRTGTQWTINGSTWEDVVRSGFTQVIADPAHGDVEIWQLRNLSGNWFHPVHIHLVDFRVLSRNGGPPRPYEAGPKDVVYVGENETVEVLIRFEGAGKYMIHCHNLVHEDHDMMTQFIVRNDAYQARDPLDEPPTWL